MKISIDLVKGGILVSSDRPVTVEDYLSAHNMVDAAFNYIVENDEKTLDDLEEDLLYTDKEYRDLKFAEFMKLYFNT